jgi:hypothetical protein
MIEVKLVRRLRDILFPLVPTKFLSRNAYGAGGVREYNSKGGREIV